MENIIPKFTSKLSNMWTKILNLEKIIMPPLSRPNPKLFIYI